MLNTKRRVEEFNLLTTNRKNKVLSTSYYDVLYRDKEQEEFFPGKYAVGWRFFTLCWEESPEDEKQIGEYWEREVSPIYYRMGKTFTREELEVLLGEMKPGDKLVPVIKP